MATSSAGSTQVAPCRHAGDVTIVGEPVGDDLEMWADYRAGRDPAMEAVLARLPRRGR
jgi:hypothetical protein